MRVHKFDPKEGQAFQGDVAIIPIPAGIEISTADEIQPKDGKLILQEGELTGHHHHIRVRNFKQSGAENIDPDMSFRDTRLRKQFIAGPKLKTAATARLFRDPSVAAKMQQTGILVRTDLMVGVLVVEGGPMTVVHEEHDGISVPVGRYYIGRQVESAGAEERVIAD